MSDSRFFKAVPLVEEVEVFTVLKSDGPGKPEYPAGYKVGGSVLSPAEFFAKYKVVEGQDKAAEWPD